jgi:hypothetical protein
MRSTEFGILPVFRGLDGALQVQRPIKFPTEQDALRAGEVFADVLGGAVAYSRVVDREAGTSENGVIIGRFGAMRESERVGTPNAQRAGALGDGGTADPSPPLDSNGEPIGLGPAHNLEGGRVLPYRAPERKHVA